MSSTRINRGPYIGMSACLVLLLAAGTTAQTTGSTSQTSLQTETKTTTGGSGQTTSKPATFTKAGAKSAPAATPGAIPAIPGSGSMTPEQLAQLQALAQLQQAGTATAAPAPSAPVIDSPRIMGPAAMNPEDVPVTDELTKEADAALASNITVSEYNTVDMFVQDEDLANVLQMLSLQSRRNIVASKDVSARVTANLYGVTFFEALDSILHVNGYGYVERGNFIYVYTLEELQQIKAEDRQVQSRVIQLNYLNANDAAEFVAPLLSDKGQIKTNGDVGSFTIPDDTPTGDEQFAMAATLVVFDYPENIDEIEKLVSNLDTKPAQVLVEATILQTQLTEANAFGVDFALLNGLDFLDFFDIGGPLGVAKALNSGDEFLPADNRGGAIVSTPGNTGGRGTLKLSLLHDDISVFIRALDEVSDVSVISNPKILALNRQSARVSIGRKIGYLKSTTNNGTTEQDVDFLPTGTSLSFRPFISKDGLIRLELKPKVSEGIINEFTDNEGRTVTVPDEVSQEVTTNVVVPDGSTVVLGGLFREETKLARSQVPLLGDIPIIGAAFRGHDDNTTRFEVIFMIKPTIVNDKILLAQGEMAVEYSQQVRTGTRQGLLPWSRDRQTAQLNVRAERLAAEGKNDQALYALRRSLELNHSQHDALRLREQLEGERNWWPARSILDNVIREEAATRGHMLNEATPETPAPTPTATPAPRASAADASASTNAEALPEFLGQLAAANAADQSSVAQEIPAPAAAIVTVPEESAASNAPSADAAWCMALEPMTLADAGPMMSSQFFWAVAALREIAVTKAMNESAPVEGIADVNPAE